MEVCVARDRGTRRRAHRVGRFRHGLACPRHPSYSACSAAHGARPARAVRAAPLRRPVAHRRVPAAAVRADDDGARHGRGHARGARGEARAARARGRHLLGYATALQSARLGCRVHTIERFATLVDSAGGRFAIAGIAELIVAAAGDGLAPDLPSGGFETHPPQRRDLHRPGAVYVPAGGGVGASSARSPEAASRVSCASSGRRTEPCARPSAAPLRLAPLVAGMAASL